MLPDGGKITLHSYSAQQLANQGFALETLEFSGNTQEH